MRNIITRGLFAALILTVFPPLSVAATRTLNIGHNVTQTANVLPEKRCTVGTQIVGCGINDRLTLAVSPWLVANYNMLNLNTRYQLESRSDLKRAVQVSYFKTYGEQNLPREAYQADPNYDFTYCYAHSCFQRYDMEALWLYYAQSKQIASNYTFHWNAQTAYYWNDRKPFSIRRPQKWRNPWQVNLMTLHELQIVEPFYLQVELGILGLIEKYPPFHTGMTLGYRADSFAVQLGFSATGSLNAWVNQQRQDAHYLARYSAEGYDRVFTNQELKTDFSIHPEFYLQFVFDI